MYWTGFPDSSVGKESEVAQLCLTLSDPMDCSPPGSSIHGIFQARVLEWGAIAFSVGKGDLYLYLQCRRPGLDSYTICWRRDGLLTPVPLGFLCGSAGKESAYNVGDVDSIPGLRRSSERGNGYPLQHSGLENSMDCIVHGVTKSWTQLNCILD